jgi:hypothetical protein
MKAPVIAFVIGLAMLVLSPTAFAEGITAPSFGDEVQVKPVVKAAPETVAPRVVEVRPTRDPVAERSEGKELGKTILRGSIITFAVTIIVGVAKFGLLLIGVPIF